MSAAETIGSGAFDYELHLRKGWHILQENGGLPDYTLEHFIEEWMRESDELTYELGYACAEEEWAMMLVVHAARDISAGDNGTAMVRLEKAIELLRNPPYSHKKRSNK